MVKGKPLNHDSSTQPQFCWLARQWELKPVNLADVVMCAMVKNAQSTTLDSCSHIPAGWLDDNGIMKYLEIGGRKGMEPKENETQWEDKTANLQW